MFLLLTYGSAFPFLHETQNSKPIFATISLSSEAHSAQQTFFFKLPVLLDPRPSCEYERLCSAMHKGIQ